MTPAIWDEWKRHRSTYARKWLRSMYARTKVWRPAGVQAIEVDAFGFSERDRAAVEKDRHLLEAALAADRLVVTRDSALRRCLRTTAKGVAIADQVRWLNPETEGVEVLEKLA